MNFQCMFRLCNQIVKQRLFIRRYAYKTVKRPDPKTLKVPDLTKAPSLMEIIKEKIRLNGPITVAEYMNIVITNPTEGYYLKDEVIGESGDFITSPEISQLFGEMIAIWFSAETKKMCSGKPLQIVELGPGKGTLIVDLLRVLHRFGYQSEDISIHLVEISETMQHMQASRLCIKHSPVDIDSPFNYQGETISGIKVYWYNDLKKVPKRFSWYIAHEFFDVLPIHRFEKTDDGWREILIDIDEQGKLRYRITTSETAAINLLLRPPLDSDERKSLEVSPRGLGIARQLAERVDSFGGIALIADYGHNGEKGDTFRAFHKHQLADPLQSPGSSDLTADVDFKQLRLAASKTPESENYALVAGPVNQREFLQRLGAHVRLQILLEHAKTEEAKEKIQAAYDMLVDPNKMGDRFKFMAFYPSSVAEILEKSPPFGFST